MSITKELIFLLVILAANIFQGITGMAGTVLAMPAAVMLVGIDTAKPILNLLGLLSGIYVVLTAHRFVNRKELGRVVLVMGVGIVGGLLLKSVLRGSPHVLYWVLGAVVTTIGAIGAVHAFFLKTPPKKQGKVVSFLMLAAAGVLHGMFVCGGPLVVSYLTERTKNQDEFRSTVSAVWVVLNAIILVDDIRLDRWYTETLELFLPAAAVLFVAMFIGTVLYRHMSRSVFMKITFILLIVSGVSLFFK